MKKRKSKQIEKLAQKLARDWIVDAIFGGCDPDKVRIDWNDMHPNWKRFFRQRAKQVIEMQS